MNRLSVLCLLLTVALGVAMAVLAMARSSRFPVRGIDLEGDMQRNGLPTLRSVAMPALAGTFFSLDLARARAAFESVPWVRRAVVHRTWPDRLRVHLEEHRPAAAWEDAEREGRLVNTHGELFLVNPGDADDEDLPQLAGPPGTSRRVLAMYRDLRERFQRLNLALERLALSDQGSWRAEFRGDVSVVLGRGSDEDVLQRADRFIRTVPQVTQEFRNPFIYADLRHAQGYAIRLRGVTTSASSAAAGVRKP